MSVFVVLNEYGPWRLAAFLAAVALFLLLHAVRCPFVLIARLLHAAQTGLDTRLTRAMTAPTATRKERTTHV